MYAVPLTVTVHAISPLLAAADADTEVTVCPLLTLRRAKGTDVALTCAVVDAKPLVAA